MFIILLSKLRELPVTVHSAFLCPPPALLHYLLLLPCLWQLDDAIEELKEQEVVSLQQQRHLLDTVLEAFLALLATPEEASQRERLSVLQKACSGLVFMCRLGELVVWHTGGAAECVCRVAWAVPVLMRSGLCTPARVLFSLGIIFCKPPLVMLMCDFSLACYP